MTKKKVKEEIESLPTNVNKTLSTGLLDAYRNALYEVEKFYRSVNFDQYGNDIELKIKVMSAVLKAGESLGKNIESLDKLEDKVKREEKESLNRRGSAKSSMFED